MKNFKTLFSLAFVLVSTVAFAQNKQANEVLEYVGAEYDHVSQGTVLKLKNLKGDVLHFHYASSDQTKVEEILFNKPSDPTTAKAVTKTELIGHKFKVGYGPIGAVDPANPLCCYKIVSVSEIPQPNGSSK